MLCCDAPCSHGGLHLVDRAVDVRIVQLCKLNELPGDLFQLVAHEAEARVDFADSCCRRVKVRRDTGGQILRALLQILECFACGAGLLHDGIHRVVDFFPRRHGSRTDCHDRAGHGLGHASADRADLVADLLHLRADSFKLLSTDAAELLQRILGALQILLGLDDLALESIPLSRALADLTLGVLQLLEPLFRPADRILQSLLLLRQELRVLRVQLEQFIDVLQIVLSGL